MEVLEAAVGGVGGGGLGFRHDRSKTWLAGVITASCPKRRRVSARGYVDVDAVTGRLNENLPKVIGQVGLTIESKYLQQHYSNWVILPLPPWGKGGRGEGGGQTF